MDETEEEPSAQNPAKFTGLNWPNQKLLHGIARCCIERSACIKRNECRRGMKALFALNQKGGFDCPSCAWPDPDDDRSRIAEYARMALKQSLRKQQQKNWLLISLLHMPWWICSAQRLWNREKGKDCAADVLPKGASHYEPVSWENAFQKIADQLNKLSSPMKRSFILRGEPAMKLHLFTSCLSVNSAPTICRIVRTCVMNPVVLPGSARGW